MTDQDKPAFAGVVARLCLALREKDPDVAMMRVYFEALKSLEIEFVTLAAERLMHLSEWFPKTSEWRAMCRTVEFERSNELRQQLRRRITPLCSDCEDTGWKLTGDPPRAKVCDCQRLRRLEVLGRRPWPELGDGLRETPDEAAVGRVSAMVRSAVRGI